MSESQELKSKGRHKRAESNSIIAKMLRKAKRNPTASFIIDVLTILAAALILSLLIKTFLIRSFFIPSGSMMETLQIDDRIIVNELVPDLIPISRGDVIVFTDPGGWLYSAPVETPTNGFVAAGEWFLSIFGLTAPDSSQHLVKRVIGVGGDHVVCCDAKGKLQINGKSITEPYVISDSKPSDLKFDVVVPANSFWVMGDNRSNSEDSRYHTTLPGKGFVPKDAVVGRAFALSWPFERWTWLDNYPNVFKDVPNN
jgi:signal peptidase I